MSDDGICLPACLPARPADRSIDRRRVGDAFAGCVMFAVYLEQCSPAAINQIQSLGEKRGATERGRARAKEDDGGCGGDRDAAAAADEEEEGKSERAAEREGDLSASVHVVVT